ncbi:hypothetical protein ACWGDT_00140 [Streptomyces avermitilis]
MQTRNSEDGIAAALDTVDLTALETATREALECLAHVRARVSRSTVNIGVSGRARNGKSTLLQSLSGLDDAQIPTGSGQPVTAVRSRIFHSTAERSARLAMHTERTFLDKVIAPYHAELDLGPVPPDLLGFSQHAYPTSPGALTAPASEHPRLAPILARLQEAQASFESYRHSLTGETRTVDLADIRVWVAYPEANDAAPEQRPYLAVRDATITCAFPATDVTSLGLVDLPGLGELVPGAEEHHLAGLRNEVDFVIMVKRPTDTNAMWAAEDAQALKLVGDACGVADVGDFALILVNTGACSEQNITALGRDLDRRLNSRSRTAGADGTTGTERSGYWVVLADAADRDAVHDEVLSPVLDHLAVALPLMDAAVIEDAVNICAARRKVISAQLDLLAAALRAVAVPTLTEQVIARADALRAEVAASLQTWVEALQRRADDSYEDTEFLTRVSDIQGAVREWVLNGFGEGAEEWQRRALNQMRVDRAALPFASGALNAVRVEMARRFGAIDDVLAQRREEYWADMAEALGPGFGQLAEAAGVAVGDDPRAGLSRLATALRDAPDPCPVLAEALDFAVDVRLDYRTRVLPRLRRALDVLHPEPDEPGAGGGTTTLLTVPRTAEGAAVLFEHVSQLARQAAYNAGVILAQEPGTTAQVLFAYGEQFEDAFVRSEASQAEFRRLTAALENTTSPAERSGSQATAARVRHVRRTVKDLRALIEAEGATR